MAPIARVLRPGDAAMLASFGERATTPGGVVCTVGGSNRAGHAHTTCSGLRLAGRLSLARFDREKLGTAAERAVLRLK